MHKTMLRAFSQELEKIADVMYGNPKNPRTAVGLFIGGTEEENDRNKVNNFMDILRGPAGGSLLKARELYQKQFPNDYVTMAEKFEANPAPTFVKKIKEVFSPPSPLEKKLRETYAERVAKPRFFLHAAPSGSSDQFEFYNDVSRGLWDNELPNAPPTRALYY